MANYEQADFYIKRAETARKNSQPDKAIELYTEAIKYCIDDRTVSRFLASALLGRAELYLNTRKHKLAVEDCTKVIDIAPNREVVWAMRGHSYCALNEADKAIEDLEIALEIAPEYIWALEGLSMAYERKKQFELAMDYIHRCIQLVTSKDMYESYPSVYLKAGNLNLRLKSYDDAIRHYTTAVEMGYGGSAWMWGNLGQAYRLRNRPGDLDRALDAIKNAIARDNHIGWFFAEFGLMLMAKGEYRGAAWNFMTATGIVVDGELVDGRNIWMKHTPEWVTDKFRECSWKLNIPIYDGEGNLMVPQEIVETRDFSEYHDLFESTFDSGQMQKEDDSRNLTDPLDDNLKLGSKLMEANQLGEAEEVFRSVVSKSPSNKKAYFLLIEVLLKQGKKRGAEMVARAAKKNNPDSEDFYASLLRPS